MAKANRATQAKRKREQTRKERQAEKGADRAVRKEQKKLRVDLSESGEDPDLIGIFPGPQPAPMEE